MAFTLTWELRASNSGAFEGTNALLDGLISILLANGVLLAGFVHLPPLSLVRSDSDGSSSSSLQLAMCVIFLTARDLPLAPVGLTILASVAFPFSLLPPFHLTSSDALHSVHAHPQEVLLDNLPVGHLPSFGDPASCCFDRRQRFDACSQRFDACSNQSRSLLRRRRTRHWTS